MTVTEQIDALETLAIDPLSYLILPRVSSMVVMLFVLTVYGDVLALLGAAFIGAALLGVSTATFWNGLLDAIRVWDLATGLIKRPPLRRGDRALQQPLRPLRERRHARRGPRGQRLGRGERDRDLRV